MKSFQLSPCVFSCAKVCSYWQNSVCPGNCLKLHFEQWGTQTGHGDNTLHGRDRPYTPPFCRLLRWRRAAELCSLGGRIGNFAFPVGEQWGRRKRKSQWNGRELGHGRWEKYKGWRGSGPNWQATSWEEKQGSLSYAKQPLPSRCLSFSNSFSGEKKASKRRGKRRNQWTKSQREETGQETKIKPEVYFVNLVNVVL